MKNGGMFDNVVVEGEGGGGLEKGLFWGGEDGKG